MSKAFEVKECCPVCGKIDMLELLPCRLGDQYDGDVCCRRCQCKITSKNWNTRAPQSEWISVNDEPFVGQEVLILLEVGGNIERGEYIGGGDFKANWCERRGENYCYKVTHWMPLPSLPKGA